MIKGYALALSLSLGVQAGRDRGVKESLRILPRALDTAASSADTVSMDTGQGASGMRLVGGRKWTTMGLRSVQAMLDGVQGR